MFDFRSSVLYKRLAKPLLTQESRWVSANLTQLLLDEVFVISRIIKVEVGVIRRRLRLITLNET